MSEMNRRTNKMIDPQFQRGMVYRIGGMALFYFLFCILVSIVLPMLLSIMTSEKEDALVQVAFRLEVLLKVMLAPLVVTFLALWVHGLQETFKIAGPSYRFRQVFAQMQNRTVPRGVRVRKDDYMQDTAVAFDLALVQVHDDISETQRRTAAALEAVRALGPEATDEQRAQAVRAVEEASEVLEGYELVGPAPACQPIIAEPHSSEPSSAESEAQPVETPVG